MELRLSGTADKLNFMPPCKIGDVLYKSFKIIRLMKDSRTSGGPVLKGPFFINSLQLELRKVVIQGVRIK